MPRQSDNKKKAKRKGQSAIESLVKCKVGGAGKQRGRARDLILMAEMEKEINNERVR